MVNLFIVLPLVKAALVIYSVKKKECPSCAMEIDKDEKVCPICQYEFPSQPKAVSWIAILLIILILFWLVL